MTDAEIFDAPWRTPAQSRDMLLELEPLNCERVKNLANHCRKVEAIRRNNPEFVQCPFCKGWHGQRDNIDNLCERHEAAFAPIRYDSQRQVK